MSKNYERNAPIVGEICSNFEKSLADGCVRPMLFLLFINAESSFDNPYYNQS